MQALADMSTEFGTAVISDQLSQLHLQDIDDYEMDWQSESMTGDWNALFRDTDGRHAVRRPGDRTDVQYASEHSCGTAVAAP